MTKRQTEESPHEAGYVKEVVWHAKCLCGWEGPSRPDDDTARLDFAEHQRNAIQAELLRQRSIETTLDDDPDSFDPTAFDAWGPGRSDSQRRLWIDELRGPILETIEALRATCITDESSGVKWELGKLGDRVRALSAAMAFPPETPSAEAMEIARKRFGLES